MESNDSILGESSNLGISDKENPSNPDVPPKPPSNELNGERQDALDALIDGDYDGVSAEEEYTDHGVTEADMNLMSTFNNLAIGENADSKIFDQSIFTMSNTDRLTSSGTFDDVLRSSNIFMPNESTSFPTKTFATDDSFFSSMDGQGSHASSASSFPVSGVQSFGVGTNPANSISRATYSPTATNHKEFLGGNRMELSANITTHSNNISSNTTSFPPPVRTFIPPTNNNEDLIVSNLPDLYAKFWELSFKLFFNVCSPSTSCHECLTIVEDIIVLVHKWGQLRSPTLVVALDVVIQRAMYELSDKMCKARPTDDPLSASERSGFRSDDGMENIEDCVSVMSHLALPLCWNIQNDFNLNFLAEGTHSLGSKMQTLNRQLQELVAWTSIVGQTKSPITFVDGATANVTDFSGVVCVDSPRSQATLEMLDHTMLSLLVENGTNQSISPEFMDGIEATLHHIISRHMGTAVDIHKCGAFALGTIFSEAGPELDYVVLTPQALQNVTNWKRLDDQPITSRGNIMKQCERIVELDLLSDNTIKHVKACIKDFMSAIGELLSAIRAFTSNRGNFPPEFLQQNYQYLMMLGGSIEEDTDHLRMSGERFLEKFESVKLNRMRTYPSLPVIISKIELLQDSIDKDDKEKNGFIRKTAKAIEKPIRDAGFAQVRCMTTRARFVHINFVAYDNRMRINVPCTVILENELPLQGTLLIREYMRYDRSGKIRGFFSIIKKFVKSHKICDVGTGFLSMFAWYIMGLHVLLRFNYIPNIHQHGLTFDENPYGPEYMAFATAKINTVHIMELLDRFFRYYVEDFDTFLRVVSIQGQGEVLRKADWPKNPVLWRISIEDPFAPLYKKHCYDLGSTLSRPGQLTTFKAMRRAVYGIRSIVAMGMELIHLARRSDYVGAAIIPPRPWNRKVNNPVLLSLKNLQEALSPDKVQAIAQLNLEDSVAMISPRDQTPRGVINSGVPNTTPVFPSGHGSGFTPSNVSNNNAAFKPKDDMNIDSRYSSMPNSGRSQYSDFQSNMSMNSNTMSLSSNNNTPRFNYGGDNQFQYQQQQSQQNLQHGQRGNNYSNYNGQSSHQNNVGMYGNNRQQYQQQQQQPYSSNNNQRYGSNVNQNVNYPPPPPPDANNYGSSPYQSSAHTGGSGHQANYYSGNTVPSAATSRQSISGIPAPNIVNGQVLNPYVPAPVDNKMKKPMVPPIPLQGISSKPMMSNNSNNMQSNDGSWSQRSAGWTNEGTYTDRYNSSMASSRSDYSSAPGGFPQNFGKVKNGMDNMSPMVTGRSSDSDGMDHYGNRAGQGNVGNYYSNQMNNNSGMFNGGFQHQQQQQQQPMYDNSGNMGNIGGNGGYNARNNRSANYGANQGYNNSNFGNNNANNSNAYQQPIHGQSWDGAPDSSRSWNGAQSSYDFGGSSRMEDQKSFNIPQGGGHNQNALWMGSNPNTARSISSGAGDFSNGGGVDDFSNNNYQSRKTLPGMDNNNANARFY